MQRDLPLSQPPAAAPRPCAALARSPYLRRPPSTAVDTDKGGPGSRGLRQLPGLAATSAAREL